MHITAAWMLTGLFLVLETQGRLILTSTPRNIVERWPLEFLHMILQDWSPTDPLGVPSLLASPIMDFALIYDGLREPIVRQRAMVALYWQRDDLHQSLYSLPKLQTHLELAQRTIFHGPSPHQDALDQESYVYDEIDSFPSVPPPYRGPIGVKRLHMPSFNYEQRRHLVALMLADYPNRMPSLGWQQRLLRNLPAKTAGAASVVTLLVEAWPLLAPVTLATLIYRLDRRPFAALLDLVGGGPPSAATVFKGTRDIDEVRSPPTLTKSLSLFSGLLKMVLGALGERVTESKRRFRELLQATTIYCVDKEETKDHLWEPKLSTLRTLMEKGKDRIPDEAIINFVEETLRQEINVAENMHEVALIKSTLLYFHIWASQYWLRSPQHLDPDSSSSTTGHTLIVRLEALVRSTAPQWIPIEQREMLLRRLIKFPQSSRDLVGTLPGHLASLLEALTVGQWAEGTGYDQGLVWDRYFRATRRMAPARHLVISPEELDDRHEAEVWSDRHEDNDWLPEVLESIHFVRIQTGRRGFIVTNRHLPRPLRVDPTGEAHLYLTDLMADRARQAYSATYGMLREVPPGSGLYCWVPTSERLVDRLVFFYSLPFLLHQGIRINMTPFPERDLLEPSSATFGPAFLSKLCPPSDATKDSQGAARTAHANKVMVDILATSLVESLSTVMQYATWAEIHERLSPS